VHGWQRKLDSQATPFTVTDLEITRQKDSGARGAGGRALSRQAERGRSTEPTDAELTLLRDLRTLDARSRSEVETLVRLKRELRRNNGRDIKAG
jgi:hypothetical protein